MKQSNCEVSVVLAVHNEETNLARCLHSVQQFADEIIIVDGKSTDKTVEIAKNFRARIISTSNKSNFHINKQMAMDASKGQLVLQLDADEEVDKQLAAFIREITKNAKLFSDVSAWTINRKNYFLGHWLKKGGQYPDSVIRLFWRGRAKLPQNDVHEQMVVDGVVAVAKGHLNHYSTPTLSVYFKKMNAYTSFRAHQLVDSGFTPSVRNLFVYFCYLPISTFLSLSIRHKGIFDGLPGMLFALLSGLHFPLQYLKSWEILQKNTKNL